MTNMYTRAQYINGDCSHDEYYNQFVNAENSAYVIGALGREKLLKKCHTKCLNEVALYEIDHLFALRSMTDASLLKSVGDNWCASTQVCIAKAIIKEFLTENGAELK